MAEAKPKLWSKAWRDTWIDDASVELDLCAIALRQYLSQHVGRVDADGVGWATTETGKPVTPARMAIVLKTPLAAVHASLTLLVQAGIALEGDGHWGTVGWIKTQELPAATRQRRSRDVRERPPGVTESVTVTPIVTGGVTTSARKSVTESVTVTTRGAEEQRNRSLTTSTPNAGAGGREETPASSRTIPAGVETLGARLTRARELVGTFTLATAATRAGIPRGLYAQLEGDEALPTPEQLSAIGRALGQPEISGWVLPERDPELVERIVRRHRDLAVELGALDPEAPVTVAAHDVVTVYAAEPVDLAAGLSLADGWARVLTRAAEQLRRELAKGNARGREFFTLRSLAGKRRVGLLAAFDLERRDDLTPVALGRRPRGPAPAIHPDQRTDGEIPQ